MTRESIVKYFRRCGYPTVKYTGRMMYKGETCFRLVLLSGDVLVYVMNNNIEIAIDAPLYCRLIGIHSVKTGKELLDKIKQNIRMSKRISDYPTEYDYMDI